ncbi:MAG: PAS domain S-box protein, partial [Myxococcota bacterium]
MPRKPPGTLSERLAHWLEASEPRLLRAGAGEGSAAERRLSRAILAEIRNSLSSESAGPPERLAGRDIARVARTTGALRDRTLALLARSRARDARSLALLAGRAFDALLTRHLSAPQKQNGKPAAGLSGPSLGSAGEAATRMILERVFEDSQQAVLVLDKHGRIIHANRALAAWYGYSPRRLRRMNVTELIAPPYRREFPRRVRKLLKDGDHQVFPALHVRRDGSHLNVQISAWLLPVDGQPWIVSILRDTTEKKRVERELKYVLSGAQCLIWQAAVTSRRGGFDWEMKPIDPAAGQTFLPLKLRRGEGYARAWHRARSDEDAARCRREVGDALRAGELAYSHEFRCVDARGRTRWIHEDIRAEPLRHRSWRLTGLCTDVTPRREAEEELRENVARFRKVFDEGPLGMAIIGLDFSFLSVNRTLCDMLGYTEREMEGLKFPDVTHPDDVDKDVSLAEKVFRGEIPHYAIEKRYLKKDGAVLWINLTASVIRDKDERPLYGLAMIEDITERRRASGELEERVRERTRALSASEEKFRTIFENAPILVDAFDENGRCTLWNRECERTLGWTRAEVLASEDPLALAYPDPAIRARILERISKGDGIFREYEVGTRDGSKRVQLWADFRLPNGSFISTGLDITERKQAENALREARDALETRVEQRTAEL